MLFGYLQWIVMGTMLPKEHQQLAHIFGVMGNLSFSTKLFIAMQPVYIRFGEIDAVRIWEFLKPHKVSQPNCIQHLGLKQL